MRIDWGNGNGGGWRVWPNGFDDPNDHEQVTTIPPQFVSFHREGSRGWLEVVDMAEMNQEQSLLAKLGEKQLALDNAISNEAQMMSLLRAIKAGTFDLNRLQFTQTGFTVLEAVELEAEAVAREADTDA